MIYRSICPIIRAEYLGRALSLSRFFCGAHDRIEIETKSSISKSMASSRIDPSRFIRSSITRRGWVVRAGGHTQVYVHPSQLERPSYIQSCARVCVCARVYASRRNQSDCAMQPSHSVIGTVLCAITNGEINHDPDQTILTGVRVPAKSEPPLSTIAPLHCS